MGRRSYGTGSITVRVDGAGRETYYGAWRANGRAIKRRLGAKRPPGSREGLTQRQAEQQLRRLMAEATPSAPIGERLEIDEVARRYVADAQRRGRKPSTCANIASETRVHLAPFLLGKAVERITAGDVADLIAALERKGLAPKTIRNVIATLSTLCNFACRKGLAGENPCAGAELPAVPERSEPRWLTLEEVDAMLAHVPTGTFAEVDRALLLTAALTGLRKGELVALRWRDVDQRARRIRVWRNYTRGAFGTPKSRLSARSIPMAPEVADALEQLRGQSRWRGEDDLVFAHPVSGDVLAKANIARRMRVALKAAGLDASHRFHDLRHTFATRLASQGVPMRALQEWMGHSDLATTQIYAKYAPAGRDAELLARAFRRETRGDIRGDNLSEPGSI